MICSFAILAVSCAQTDSSPIPASTGIIADTRSVKTKIIAKGAIKKIGECVLILKPEAGEKWKKNEYIVFSNRMDDGRIITFEDCFQLKKGSRVQVNLVTVYEAKKDKSGNEIAGSRTVVEEGQYEWPGNKEIIGFTYATSMPFEFKKETLDADEGPFEEYEIEGDNEENSGEPESKIE